MTATFVPGDGQPPRGELGLPDALLGERDVGPAGEPALAGQLGLPVPQQQRGRRLAERRTPARPRPPELSRAAPARRSRHRPDSGVLTRIRRHSSQRSTSSSGAALIAFRSTVLSVRLQPWQRRRRSAAAPTPPCCALSLSYSSSRSPAMVSGDLGPRGGRLGRLLVELGERPSRAAMTVCSSASIEAALGGRGFQAGSGWSRAAPSHRERFPPGQTACAGVTGSRTAGSQVLWAS